MFYLNENIISSNRNPYAVKGEQVKIISDHDNCIIAESIETLKRFGVNKKYLSEDYIAKEQIVEIKKSKKC